MKPGAVAATALFGALALATSRAEAADDAPPVQAAFTLGTEFPIDVEVAARVELPHRIRLTVGAGLMPGPYSSAINGFLEGVGAYDEATADLVASTLSSSFVLRAHGGFRFFPEHGFYADGGYRLVTLGGSSEAAAIVAVATGQPVPAGEEERPVDVASTLHMIDLELGWELHPIDHLIVRPSVGGAFTVGASTTIEPQFDARARRLVEGFARYGEDFLDDTYTSYVFSPVLGIAVGYEL